MKYFLLSLCAAFIFDSCQWAPAEIDIDVKSTFSRINIAVGDTAQLDINGFDFYSFSGVDPDVVEILVETSNEGVGHFQFIGIAAGQLDISTKYSPFSHDETASYYINLNISEGIPLALYIGEPLLLNLGDYFDESLLSELDSISLLSTDGSEIPLVDFEIDVELKRITLLGVRPGFNEYQVVMYDGVGIQIAPLLLECDIKIRNFVLAEMFTNSGCVNCPEANGYLDNIYDARSDQLNVVRYHVSWTDPNDPMNLYNPSEVTDRVLYYNSFLAPSFIVNGVLISSLDENDWVNRIISAASSEAVLYLSPIDVQESNDSLFLDFDLETFGVELGSMTCWSLVLEDSIEFAGSNGEDLHMQVMRDMSSSSLAGSESAFTIQHSLKKPDDFGAGQLMSLLVFVQSDADKSILQSRKHFLY